MIGRLLVRSAPGAPVPPRGAPALGSSPSVADAAATTPSADAPLEAAVEVRDFAFANPSVRIRTGGKVTWSFAGRAPHSVTATDASFDSGVVENGAVFSHAFDRAGTFTYSCLVHPAMQATVEVVDISGALPVAAASGDDNTATAGGRGPTSPWTVAVLGGAGVLASTGVFLGLSRRLLFATP